MRITERDIDLFRWINRFGFVTVEHISEIWRASRSVVYRRLSRLVEHGYLCHERVLHKGPGVYWLDKRSIEIAESELPAVRQISLSTFKHQLMIVTVYLKLNKIFQKIKTEREIMAIQCQRNIGGKPHVPDLLIEEDNEKIAIEIELTTKGRQRLIKILSQYRKDFNIKKVLYLCGSNEVFNQLSQEERNYPFLEVRKLDTWLAEKDNAKEL